MLQGVNDSLEDAKRILKLTANFGAKVNLGDLPSVVLL